jgi:hypothetical protein
VKQVGQLLLVADDPHAAPAAAGRSFDDHRETHAARPLHGLVSRRDNPVRARQDGHAFLLHGGAGFFLLAHQARDLRWADELDAAGLRDFGKVGVLAQQAVARMNGVDIGDFSGADDGGNVEIALVQARRANADGFVGKATCSELRSASL